MVLQARPYHCVTVHMLCLTHCYWSKPFSIYSERTRVTDQSLLVSPQGKQRAAGGLNTRRDGREWVKHLGPPHYRVPSLAMASFFLTILVYSTHFLAPTPLFAQREQNISLRCWWWGRNGLDAHHSFPGDPPFSILGYDVGTPHYNRICKIWIFSSNFPKATSACFTLPFWSFCLSYWVSNVSHSC